MTKIRLDACTHCQLSCPTCPNSEGLVNRHLGSGSLTSGDFQKLLNANPEIQEIEISNFGEPFLNSQLPEIFRYAFDNGVIIRADNGCNFNNISEEIRQALCQFRVASVTCSIDGGNNRDYSVYRKQGSFTAIIDNIQKLNTEKERYNTKFPELTWQFVIMPHNIRSLGVAKEIAKSLDMSFIYKLSWGNPFFSDEDRAYAKGEYGLETLTRDEYLRKNGTIYYHQVCYQLWKAIQFNWNGDLLGCCNNYWSVFEANILKNGYQTCATSPNLDYARNMLLGIANARSGIPCTDCSVYKAMKDNGLWLSESIANNGLCIDWTQ